MNLSAIHKGTIQLPKHVCVVCDIGGYEFVSYSQGLTKTIMAAISCL